LIIEEVKALGPDGLNHAFYKSFLSLCGKEDEVVVDCHWWLHEGNLPTMLGDTNIVLIPKYNQPRTVRDLGLVFLCNLVYKILVKTMATRLQKVLGTCISI
jgi:hypothetical protein